MSSRQRGLLLLALALGCSSLQGDTSGVVAIEVVSPRTALLEDRDTLNMATRTLSARALNLQGDSIDAPIKWTSADSLAVIIDSVIPYVVGAGTSGSPRLQARIGSLGSAVITFSLGPRSDTLTLLGSDSIVVPPGGLVSDSLDVALMTYDSAGVAPISNRRLFFAITSPVFANPADRTVEFTNGGLADTAVTGATGDPISGVRLSRITGKTAPDSVVVTVSARRPSGRAVPGLTRPIRVYFQ